MRLVELKLLPLLLHGAGPVRLVCPPRRAKEVAVYSPSKRASTVLEFCRPFVAEAGLSVQTENLGFAPVNKSATDLLVPVELAASDLGLLCE
jgi:hypothetical protein